MESDEALAVIVNGMLCTCEVEPMGLPLVLCNGCLVHDQCVCNEPERGTMPCAWCAAYVALLKAIGSLGELTREHLKRLYRQQHATI